MFAHQRCLKSVVSILVSELSKTLVKIQKHLNDCIPLVNRINTYLPDNQKLDYFSLNPNATPRKASGILLPTGMGGTSPLVRIQEPLEEDTTEHDEP